MPSRRRLWTRRWRRTRWPWPKSPPTGSGVDAQEAAVKQAEAALEAAGSSLLQAEKP